MSFEIHTPDTAPEASRPILDNVLKNYGFLPNLAAGLAHSPALLAGFGGLAAAYDGPEMTLKPLERQVVLLAVSTANRCNYCTAAHSMLANNAGLARDQIDRLVMGLSLDDPRLETLRRFATALTNERGWVGEAAVKEFVAAGFDRRQVLEIVLGVTLKTLTNYANHLIDPQINEQFAAFAPKKTA